MQFLSVAVAVAAPLLVVVALQMAVMQMAVMCEATTVDGCDGHLCDLGEPSKLLFGNRDRALVFSQCHAYCLQNARSGNTAWPIRSIESLTGNCITFRNITECRRGCVLKNGGSSSISSRQCKVTCKNDCNRECPPAAAVRCFYNNTDCIFDCDSKGCRVGCAMTLPSLDPSISSSNPPSSLTLNEKGGPLPRPPGLYNLDSYSIPEHVGSTAPNMAAFLFEISNGSESFYTLQTSLVGETLDLSFLACRNVSISFAAVTMESITQFSPAVNTCVYGATRYPDQVNISTIRYTLALDNRTDEGFLKNVVVNMTWTRPEDDNECASQDTELERYRDISGDASFFTIHARSPIRAPIINCNYQYTLQLFPHRGPTKTTYDGVINTHKNKVIPEISLTCSTSIDPKTGLASAKAMWEIPDPAENQVVIDALDKYFVVYRWVNMQGQNINAIITIRITTVLPDENGAASFVEDGLTPTTEESKRIFIDISPNLSQNSTFQHLPDRAVCLLEVTPNSPDPVNASTIALYQYSINSTRIQLNMTWNKPDRPFGTIMNYQVRLLREMSLSGDDVSPSLEITKTKEEMVTLPDQIIQEETSYIKDTDLCVFVQVRAMNEYFWGNWSDTVPILRYPNLHPKCQLDDGITGLPLTTWVGLGVGLCVLVSLWIVCSCLCVCICKRHRMKVQMRRAFENGYSNPMFAAGGRSLQRRNSAMRIPLTLTDPSNELDEWEIPVGSVIVDSKFGEGCFGEVHRGVVRGPLPTTRTMKSNICVTVAIKMLKKSATGSERTDFLHEIDTMKRIAQGMNPHVITFIGCVTVQEPLSLITEFVKYGDLLSYLETIRKLITHNKREMMLASLTSSQQEPEPYLVPQHHREEESHGDRGVNGGGGAEWDPKTGDLRVLPGPDSLYAALGEVEPVNLISFAYQIASGMEYLSSLDIVHRDIACRNILIGENKSLKISDFGMSRVVTGEDIYVKTTKGRLPWKWMAIESIVNREFTHASDVWSYGVALWEIATLGGFPYPMTSNAELLDHLKRGHRLECPDNCSPEIYKVMLECWNENPNSRKTFPELRLLFDAMLAEENPYIQFDNINARKSYYNTRSSQRNSRVAEEENTVALDESEAEFEASSTSTITFAGSSAAYDYLRASVPPNAEVTLDDHGQLLHAANQYVETPTFKFLKSQESLELSDCHSEVDNASSSPPQTQAREIESSTEIQMEMNSITSVHTHE